MSTSGSLTLKISPITASHCLLFGIHLPSCSGTAPVLSGHNNHLKALFCVFLSIVLLVYFSLKRHTSRKQRLSQAQNALTISGPEADSGK